MRACQFYLMMARKSQTICSKRKWWGFLDSPVLSAPSRFTLEPCTGGSPSPCLPPGASPVLGFRQWSIRLLRKVLRKAWAQPKGLCIFYGTTFLQIPWLCPRSGWQSMIASFGLASATLMGKHSTHPFHAKCFLGKSWKQSQLSGDLLFPVSELPLFEGRLFLCWGEAPPGGLSKNKQKETLGRESLMYLVMIWSCSLAIIFIHISTRVSGWGRG